MNRRQFLQASCLTVGALAMQKPARAADPAAGAPPNIVCVLADVSCCNPQSKIATPNIDSVAKAGRLFTDAPSGSAVWTPTRYGLKEKDVPTDAPPSQFYNLHDDPTESNNLYAGRTEVATRLKGLLERYQRDGRSAPRRPPGGQSDRSVG